VDLENQPLLPFIDVLARHLLGLVLWLNHNPMLCGAVMYVCLATAFGTWCFMPGNYGQVLLDRNLHPVTRKPRFDARCMAGLWVAAVLVNIWAASLVGGTVMFLECAQPNANVLWCDGLQPLPEMSSGYGKTIFLMGAALKFLSWSAVAGVLLAFMKTSGSVIDMISSWRQRRT
jgi:hypothetical protein